LTRSKVQKSDESYDKEISYILASNHISYIDPFLVTPAAGLKAFRNVPYRFMAYNGYLDKWYLKWFMLPLGCFPSHPHRKFLHGISAGHSVLDSYQTVVMFPQGKRTLDKTIPAKFGVQRLSQSKNVRILPVLLTKRSKIGYNITIGTSFNANSMTAQQIMNRIYKLDA
jgi:1-acyl-sn-glycerol-3-phosphate acyltransferase